MGEYGASYADVKAETIWLSPELNTPVQPNGGDDGVDGYAPLAVATGGALYWVHGNHLGVPLVLTDNVGNIAAPTGYTPVGFPGQTRTLADLYYNRYRDYDPTIGRYIQADPIGLEGGGNPYVYAGNNPINAFDAMGLKVEIRCRKIGDPVNPDWKARIAARLGGEHCFIVIYCKDKKINSNIPPTTVSYLSNVSISVNGKPSNNDTVYSNMKEYRVISVTAPATGCDHCKFEKCVVDSAKFLSRKSYAMTNYDPILGPNSNSFARRLVEMCEGSVGSPGPLTGWNSASSVGF